MISLRRLQISVQVPVRTRLEKWFDESCRVLVSLLPTYFDRVSAFAKPLYGFDPVPAPSSPFQDWEAKVNEFLRKQDKAGGPPTAVAVVLDALGATNLHLERGFQMEREEVKDVETAELPERTLWPAVYMRSTLHMDRSVQQHRSHHGRGSSSKGYLDSQSGSEQSTSRMFMTPSVRSLDVESHSTIPKNRVLEYGPDTGTATSWPHSEWTALVSLLELSPVSDDLDSSERIQISEGLKDSFRMAEELVAVTYRDGPETAQKEFEPATTWKPSLEKAVRMFGVYANSEMNAVDPHAVREHAKQSSTFHVVSLSKYLSMIVMVKDEEESHFLRRRNPFTDEEIREFMNGMAAYWNVTRRFSQECLPQALSTTRIELAHEEWDSAKIEELIQKIKSAFGLRPTSYPLTEGHRGISFLGMNSPKKATRRAREMPVVQNSQSAAIFFLGPQLANMLD